MLYKLFIYDIVDDDNRKQAESRFSKSDGGVVSLPCSTRMEVVDGLDKLVKKGTAFFDSVLVQTHGKSGFVSFGKDDIGMGYVLSSMKGRGYEKLFPLYTKIYFDGCNVAADPHGPAFLKTIGETLLIKGGGIVLGFTTPGYAFPDNPTYSPVLELLGDGHTRHLGGLRTFEFGPGGKFLPPPPEKELYKLAVGNKL